MIKRSITLENIARRWCGPKDENGGIDLRPIEALFDLKDFVMENDQFLALLKEPTGRVLSAKQTLLPNVGAVWVVYQGPLTQVKRQPIAWFMNVEDMNRFIFGVDERAKMQAEIDHLKETCETFSNELGDFTKFTNSYCNKTHETHVIGCVNCHGQYAP